MLSSIIQYRLKSAFLLLLILGTFCSFSQVHFDFMGGVNYSKISVKEFNRSYFVDYNATGFVDTKVNSRLKPRYSFFGGIKADIDLTNSISVSAKFLLESKGFIDHFQQIYRSPGPNPSDTVHGKTVVKLLYLTVPLHFVFYAALKKSRIYLGLGVFGSYGLYGTNQFYSKYSSNPDIRDSISYISFSSSSKVSYGRFHAKRLDYGLSLISGIQFRNHFFIEAGFNNGLVTILKDRFILTQSNSDAIIFSLPNKIREFMLGIGYRIK